MAWGMVPDTSSGEVSVALRMGLRIIPRQPLLQTEGTEEDSYVSIGETNKQSGRCHHVPEA